MEKTIKPFNFYFSTSSELTTVGDAKLNWLSDRKKVNEEEFYKKLDEELDKLNLNEEMRSDAIKSIKEVLFEKKAAITVGSTCFEYSKK